MSFRARLLWACLFLALVPLAAFGLGVRRELVNRLSGQYAERVDLLADGIERALEDEARGVSLRLERLGSEMAADNEFRLAVLGGAEAPEHLRSYLIDYATRVMPLVGLDLLRVQDADGRILTSGHFRNEFDAVDPDLPAALATLRGKATLVSAETPAGAMLALADSRTLTLGPVALTLVGGTAVDDPFVAGLAGGTDLAVALELPGQEVTPPPDKPVTSAREVTVPFVASGARATARFVVSASNAPLLALREDLDRLLALTLTLSGALAAALVLVASARLSGPLRALADKASRLDLDRLQVSFATGGRDEVGALSRVLDRMTRRLRTSTGRLRDAERRAATADLARQVNHDVKNGLIPIRNVVSHLGELARDEPARLRAVFLEREGTLRNGVDYLQSLATNYARLAPTRERHRCDVNALVGEVVGDALDRARVTADLDPSLPDVTADPVSLRRIVDNLVSNAIDSLPDGQGSVDVATRWGSEGIVHLVVADTGIGMSDEERAHAFDDFFTTKPTGSGLGLSIVRRLVSDLGGRVSVESNPGQGSRFTVELPAEQRTPT